MNSNVKLAESLELFSDISGEEILRDHEVTNSLTHLSPSLHYEEFNSCGDFSLAPKLVDSSLKTPKYIKDSSSCPDVPVKRRKLCVIEKKISCGQLVMKEGKENELILHLQEDNIHNLSDDVPSPTFSHCSSCTSGKISKFESPDLSDDETWNNGNVLDEYHKSEFELPNEIANDHCKSVKSPHFVEDDYQITKLEDGKNYHEASTPKINVMTDEGGGISSSPTSSVISGIFPLKDVNALKPSYICSHYVTSHRGCRWKVSENGLSRRPYCKVVMKDVLDVGKDQIVITSTPIDVKSKFNCSNVSTISETSNDSSYLKIPKISKFVNTSEILMADLFSPVGSVEECEKISEKKVFSSQPVFPSVKKVVCPRSLSESSCQIKLSSVKGELLSSGLDYDSEL